MQLRLLEGKKRVHAKNKTFKIQMLEHTIDVSEVKI